MVIRSPVLVVDKVRSARRLLHIDRGWILGYLAVHQMLISDISEMTAASIVVAPVVIALDEVRVMVIRVLGV